MPVARKAFTSRCKYLLVALAILFPMVANAQPAKRGAAKVYFIHPAGIFPNVVSVDIKINGRVVGSLKEGTYIVRSVPAGSATFTATAGWLDPGFETQMNVTAGRSYYIGVNLWRSPHIGQQALNTLFYGEIGGKRLASTSFMSTRTLELLDEAAGRATVAKFKRIP